MTSSETNISELTQKIQGLKEGYLNGQMDLDALLFSVAIAGVKEAEDIFKSARDRDMDEEAKWIKENQMYQVRDEE